MKFDEIVRDYVHLGIDRDLAAKLAEVEMKEAANKYYRRTQEESQLFEASFKQMRQKAVFGHGTIYT